MRSKSILAIMLAAVLLLCAACGTAEDETTSSAAESTEQTEAQTQGQPENGGDGAASEETTRAAVPLRQLDVTITRIDCAGMDWKEAYLSIVQDEAAAAGPDSWLQFALIYIDYDDVPELVIDTGNQETGCRILTYSAEAVSVLQTNRLWFTYIETEDLLCNSDGMMDDFFDIVCAIEEGEWIQVASGHYDSMIGWDEVSNRPVCERYTWNGQEVTMAEYYVALRQVYDSARGKAPEAYLTAEEIEAQLSE